MQERHLRMQHMKLNENVNTSTLTVILYNVHAHLDSNARHFDPLRSLTWSPSSRLTPLRDKTLHLRLVLDQNIIQARLM